MDTVCSSETWANICQSYIASALTMDTVCSSETWANICQSYIASAFTMDTVCSSETWANICQSYIASALTMDTVCSTETWANICQSYIASALTMDTLCCSETWANICRNYIASANTLVERQPSEFLFGKCLFRIPAGAPALLSEVVVFLSCCRKMLASTSARSWQLYSKSFPIHHHTIRRYIVSTLNASLSSVLEGSVWRHIPEYSSCYCHVRESFRFSSKCLFANVCVNMRRFVTLSFWDVSPCSPSEVYRLSGGSYRLHLHGWSVSQASNQQYIGLLLSKTTLQPRRWRQYVPPKRRLTFNGIHRIIPQNIENYS
jgi:hypothetical protein